MKKETYIYGIRPTIEAIKAGKELEKIFLQNGLKGDGFRDLFNLIKELEIPFQFVPVEKGRIIFSSLLLVCILAVANFSIGAPPPNIDTSS